MIERTSRRLAVRLVTAASVVVAGWCAAPAGAAGGWTDGACPTPEGVTVVVDFAAFGRGVVVRCATGSFDSGFDALRGAGFSIAEPASTPGFVCRLDQLPGPDQESCASTPPQDSYWAYWRAPRGGSWTYSSIGALSRGTAKPGSVQGWAFSDGTNPQPRVAPPAAAAPTTVPAPATTAAGAAPAPGAAPSGGSPTTSGAPSSKAAGAGATTSPPRVLGATTTVSPASAPPTDPGASTTVAAAPVTEEAPTSTSTSASTSAPADSDGSTALVHMASADTTSDDAGSPLPTVLVGAAVVTLGAATAVVARRRR